jgi:aspartate/methionine/tyrosine aminotransferase
VWFKRMSIEAESPEEFGYGAIAYNLSESSVPDRTVDIAGVELGDLLACYGHHRGRPDLRTLIASKYPRLSADQFLVTGGAAEALFVVAATVLKPGDHIVVEHPNYPSNYEVPRSLGCHVDALALQFDSQFELDLDKLAALVTPRTKLISLTYPHNPTGTMISADALNSVVALAESRGILLLLDETYRELAFDEKLPTAASLSPNAVSISSLSKAYGFPGLRIGWIATRDKSLLDSFLATKEQINICNSVVDEALACAVLDRREQILSEGRTHVRANYELLADWMATQTVLEWVPPTAGVVCFPRIKNDLRVDLASFYQSLRDRYKTFVGPGHWFEQDDRYFRVGYGWPTKEDLGIGLENLRKAVLESTLSSGR